MKNYSTVNSFLKQSTEKLSEDQEELLRCWECNVNFTSRYYLNDHLLHHIKQPVVILNRYKIPLKITLKNKNNSFEIINSPQSLVSSCSPQNLNNNEENLAENIEGIKDGVSEKTEEAKVSFSPNYVEGYDANSPFVTSENSNSSGNNLQTESAETDGNQEYANIPGAEPTPPPELSPSPEYPKIRIKTTGLLKESLTITEITDDNPNGDIRCPEMVDVGPNGDSQCSSGYGSNQGTEGNSMWTTPSLEDPLQLPDINEKEHGNLLSLFSNDNERAKDLGFTTSENEFISLDGLDDRNRNAMQIYNSHAITSTAQQNPLDSLAGLPMQQLAQQVSRLQPGNGMHQQNVLINIQQFPQAPPQPQPPHGYQPPPMYHHPPHPSQPPMYQPYQYQPPNHMYYPPAPTYSHMPPPPPQLGQPPPQQMPTQQPMQQSYRPPAPPRHPIAPRQVAPRAPVGSAPRHPGAPRQPTAMRQRAPVPRPRGGMVGVRAPMRPRMQGANNASAMHAQNNPQRLIKRSPEQIQALQAKRKKMDVLVPDKNDDPDCQVICTQPKNTDGGLPQIQSVQGGTPDPSDGNVMHLSDSITLSVRNPPPSAQTPKKSDAKAVANILATRGITVTATAKPKHESPIKTASSTPPPAPVAINLNNAVSIIPSGKTNSKPNASDARLPTVDLTDDTVPETPQTHAPSKQTAPMQKPPPNQRGLPFKCDLCPAQYPNAVSLNKHKQTYHKTGGPCQVGVPLINLKQTGVIQKLSSLGIFNYIPLPGAGSDGTFGIPVINARNPGNAAAIGASSILTLGPIRSIPRPNINNAGGK